MAPELGTRGEVSIVVVDADTAIALGSGDVPVLGTPRLIAVCEAATVAALVGQLDEDRTTVGMRIRVDHLAPTAVGATVTAEAVLEKVEGPRLTFTVSASDVRGPIGVGRITRVIVHRERFMDKLNHPDS